MESLLILAREAALRASDAILPHYGTTTFELKDDNSPVTKADNAAHEVLVRTLETSGIPILSEESEGVVLPYPERLWIVDPLDGTKGFLKHTDDFSVMIALIENGRPVLAVVNAPVMKKHYYATRGGGAYVVDEGGERRLTVSNRIQPNLRGIVSVNHAAQYMFDVMHTLAVTETIAVGSVGIKSGYIAENRADFYVNRGALGEWDVCAPELIVIEAGGMVTDTHGELLYYGNKDHRITRGVVLTNGTSHDTVLESMQHV